MKKLLFMSPLVFIAWGIAVRSAPQAASGSIEGVVVNSVTLQPLSNVQVSVRREDASPQTTVLSDQNGHFSISGVPVGTLTVSAFRDGYFGPELNGTVPPGLVTSIKVTEGQSSRISMSLLPGGTISGSVLDDRGAPAFDANVQVLLVAYSNGKAAVEIAGSRTTDDRGNYRIFGLRPGEYYVAANPKQAIAVQRLANFALDGRGGAAAAVSAAAPVSTPAEPASVRTFCPNATNVSQASRIRLHAGEEVSGISFSFKVATVEAVKRTDRF